MLLYATVAAFVAEFAVVGSLINWIGSSLVFRFVGLVHVSIGSLVRWLFVRSLIGGSFVWALVRSLAGWLVGLLVGWLVSGMVSSWVARLLACLLFPVDLLSWLFLIVISAWSWCWQ